MKTQRPEIVRTTIAAACVLALSVYAFGFAGSAEAMRTVDEATESAVKAAYRPTSRDFAYHETRMRKISNAGKLAETCGQGQLLGGTSIHVAMQFPKKGTTPSSRKPDVAVAHVEPGRDPKALILDSEEPTLWVVTGDPAMIVLAGNAVLADAPEDTPFFAPRFAENCAPARWVTQRTRPAAPKKQDMLQSILGDVRGAYDRYAAIVTKGVFKQDFESWKAQRGAGPFHF